MTKRMISLVLVVAMVLTIFAGLTLTTHAADGTYTQVTDASTLAAGDTILLAKADSSAYAGAMGTSAFFTSVSTQADAIEITLSGDSTGWTFTTSEGTIGTSAAKKLNHTGSGTTTWTISIDSDGLATIASTNSSYGKFLYNVNSPRFLNYASNVSSSMQLPIIYKKDGGSSTGHTHSWGDWYTNNDGTHSRDCDDPDSDCPDPTQTADCTYGATTVVTAATCSSVGSGTHTCTVCGYTETVEIPVDANAHNWEWDGDDAVNGFHKLVCSVCGAETSQACSDGDSDGYCDVCSTAMPAVPVGGGDYELASTLEDGDYIFGAVKGDIADDTAIGAVHGELSGTWGAYTVVTPANGLIAETDAQDIFVWTLTNVTGGITLQNKSTGKYLSLPTGTGSSGGKPSFSDTAVTIYYSTLDATANTFKLHPTDSSTNQLACNFQGSYGYRMYATRTQGNASGICVAIRFYKQAAATNTCTHDDIEFVAAVPSTCTVAGNIAHWYCPDCDQYFADDNGQPGSKIAASSIALALAEHDWQETATVASTCSAAGHTDYECSVCHTTKSEELPLAAHNYEWDGDDAVNGFHKLVCTVCGAETSQACSDGDSDGYCDVCECEMPEDKVFTLNTELHDGDQVVIVYTASNMALTTTASGTKLAGEDVSAAISGTSLTVAASNTTIAVLTVEMIDGDANNSFYLKTADNKYLTSAATGNGVSFADSESDCAKWYLRNVNTTNNTVGLHNAGANYNGNYNQAMEYYSGFTTYGWKDNNSAYVFSLYTIVNQAAHVHDWDQGTVTTPATCTAEGVMTYECLDCGDTREEAIPMIAHADDNSDGVCDNCSGTLYDRVTTLADGDEIAIYNVAGNAVLTTTASESVLEASTAYAHSGVIALDANFTSWFTVKYTDTENFYLIDADGNYLTSGETGSALTLEATADANGLSEWNLAQPAGIDTNAFVIYNKAAKYNSTTAQVLEYYNSTMTTYSLKSDLSQFAFEFYAKPAAPVDPNQCTFYIIDQTGNGYTYAYAYKNGTDAKNAEWPGVAMTNEGEEFYDNATVYSYTFDRTQYDRLIFATSDGNNQSPEYGVWNGNGAKNCFYIQSNNNFYEAADFYLKSSGKVTTPATCTTDGVKTYYGLKDATNTVTETIVAPGHTAPDPIVYEKDSTNHWYICTVCNQIAGVEAHTFVNGVCSVCGKEEDQTLTVGGWYVLSTKGLDGGEMELSGFNGTNPVYGTGRAYTTNAAGLVPVKVVNGSGDGKYYLQLANGEYLIWESGKNGLNRNATATDWAISFSGATATIKTPEGADVDADRTLAWNKSATRFATYKDATLSSQGGSYSAVQLIPITTYVANFSLSTLSTIELNLYLKGFDGAPAVTIGSETIYGNKAEATINGYKYTYSVPAKDFDQDLTVTVNGGSDDVYKAVGSDQKLTTISVKDYIGAEDEDATVGKDNTTTVADVVKAMNNYGEYAKAYFDATYTATNLYPDVNYSNLTASSITSQQGYTAPSRDPKAGSVYFHSGSLVLKGQILMRLYFYVPAGADLNKLDSVAVTKNGTAVDFDKNTVVLNGTKYLQIDIPLDATDLGAYYGVTVTYDNVEASVSNFSGLYYISRTIEKSADENLVALVKALYGYYDKAKGYFVG